MKLNKVRKLLNDWLLPAVIGIPSALLFIQYANFVFSLTK